MTFTTTTTGTATTTSTITTSDDLVCNTQEAAYFLRKELGPCRAWTYVLTDCRHGKTTKYNITPAFCVKGIPYYWRRDLQEFVDEFLSAHPTSGPGQPIEFVKPESLDPLYATRYSVLSKKVRAMLSAAAPIATTH